MDAAAGRADALGQAALQRGLAILIGELDVPRPRWRVRRPSAVSAST